MATGTLQDHSLGTIPEVTYGTPLTVTRWPEFLPSSKMDWDPAVIQGSGMRTGSAVDRSGRRVQGVQSGKGNLDVEVVPKGLGTLFNAALGSGTSTLVSGSTYQQVFYPLQGTTLAPSMTWQAAIVEAGGTIDAFTYAGVCITDLELDLAENGVLIAKFGAFAKSLATGTAYATPAFAASPVNLLPVPLATATVGGAVTVPTTIAMATGGTAVTDVRSFTLKIANNLSTRKNIGGLAQPTFGERQITGSMVIEYDALTYATALQNQTALPITLTFTTATSLSTGFEQFQVCIPEAKLDKAIPDPSGTDLVTAQIDFTVLDNLTAAHPLYLSFRTSDVAF